MPKTTFSKRKTKFAGLCGAILATTTVAVSLGTTAQADEATAADTSAPKANLVQDKPAKTSTPIKTETVDTTANQAAVIAPVQNAQVTSSIQATIQDQAVASAPAQAQVSASEEQASQAPATASQAASQAPAQPDVQPASAATTVAKTAVSTQPANTTEYGSVDFDQTLSQVQKTAPVTDVKYNGTADEYIEVDNPNQAYTPNAQAITQYLNEYLTELRQINGIDIPVPAANELMRNFAQARADEEAREADSIDHQTSLAFPDGVTTYSEDGHEDSLDSITPKNAAGQSLGSDKATAYYLALNWFADYFNIASGSGKEAFGHAISVLSNGGDGMALGLANGTGNEKGGFYAMLEFGGSGNNIVNDADFTVTKDGAGNYVLNYKGQAVKFLPKTTFHYVSKNSAAAPTASPQAEAQTPANQPNQVDQAPANQPSKAAETPAPTPAQDPAGQKAAGAGAAKANQVEDPKAGPAPEATPKTVSTNAAAQSAGMGAAKETKEAQLPETGQADATAVTALGAAMVVTGLGLAAKRKIEAQD